MGLRGCWGLGVEDSGFRVCRAYRVCGLLGFRVG